jgi:hydrogenase nickel incorporation protein HypB
MKAGLFAVNLLSGPGAGKTSLLEATLSRLGGSVRCLVVEGDLRTARDAERIAATGADAVQIVTNGVCHLDSRMVTSALTECDLESLDALIIENVGNLVCPTGFDLGESARVVIGSVPEGADKPEKYPFMFEKADVVILNKIDLLEHVPFDKASFWRHVESVNPRAIRLEISCTTGEGIEPWLDWFAKQVERHRTRAAENA